MGIQRMLQCSGFSVKTIHCFNSNDISKPISKKFAKEIFVVAQKISLPRISPWSFTNRKDKYWE